MDDVVPIHANSATLLVLGVIRTRSVFRACTFGGERRHSTDDT